MSYIWGVVAFDETPKNTVLSAAGVFVLIVGVVCIAFNGPITEYLVSALGIEDANSSPSALLSLGGDSDNHSSHTAAKDSDQPWIAGLMWAIATGTAGGSVLVPLHYTPAEAQGMAFIPSFGVGAMAAAPVVAALFFAVEGKVPETHWKICLPVGILSGTLYNISNSLAIVAIPSLGYAVAYPILQCALFVAGIWGIFAFKEIKGKEVVVFFASGCVLIAGAVSIAIAA